MLYDLPLSRPCKDDIHKGRTEPEIKDITFLFRLDKSIRPPFGTERERERERERRESVRARIYTTQTQIEFQGESKLWSIVRDWARYQDILTD
jgi:hypothetical protein